MTDDEEGKVHGLYLWYEGGRWALLWTSEPRRQWAVRQVGDKWVEADLADALFKAGVTGKIPEEEAAKMPRF